MATSRWKEIQNRSFLEMGMVDRKKTENNEMSYKLITDCCDTDIESDTYIDAVQKNCNCSAMVMPPCHSCCGSTCAMCGTRDFNVTEVHDDPQQQVKDDYDRAMGILDK